MTEPSEHMLQLAERLEAIVEEMTDMAIEALRRASSGDPDSAEAGEAMALERRIVRARRALEKSIAVLSERGRGARDDLVDGGAA